MRQSDLERIWERDILPVISVQAVTDHPPTTVFLGGQPAAGKTRAQKIMTCLCGGLLLPIVGDDFRRFHPDYESLIRTSPLSMPHETAQAAGYWTGRAVEKSLIEKQIIRGDEQLTCIPISEHQFDSILDLGEADEGYIVD